MSRITAAQQRLFDNAVSIAANRLLFDAMRRSFHCPNLVEIVTIHNGQGLVAKEREKSGKYDVYAAGGLIGQHSVQLTDKPFVVIGRKGSAGKPTYAPFGGWVIDTAYYAQPKKEVELDCKFLFYAISSLNFTNDIISTAIPGINRTSIYRYSIPLPPRGIQEACIRFLDATAAKLGELPPLPPPLEEQRSLVARIEELAAKIAEARGLRSKALEETKALLPSVVEQVLKTLRSSAEEVTVESIAKSVTDGDHQPPPKADFGIPFIFINHVVGGKINFSGCKWVPLEYFSRIAASRVPKPGDVLYTAVGSYGIPCLVETNEPFCFQRHIAIIKPDQSLILSKYLTWVLSSPDIFNQATKAATGSAQLTVPLRGIRKLKFPLPPLPEQRRIVAYLDNLQSKVDALKHLQAETTAELNALLPSILDKAFKGEL